MNKTMKKIAAAITTAVMAAIPMAGSLTANAAPAGWDEPKYYFGDLDGDKEVTAWDATLILRASKNNGADLKYRQKIKADVNGDGRITKADSDLALEYYVNNTVSGHDLYGDANNDGEVDIYDAYTVYDYVNDGLGSGLGSDTINFIAADVNADGVINSFDHVLIARYALGYISSLYVNWGDVNSDGSVDVWDRLKLAKFCAGDHSVSLTSAEIRRGDLNLDGNTDSDDLTILIRYTGDQYFTWS